MDKEKSLKKFFGRYPQMATLIGFIVIVIFFSIQKETFMTKENLSNIANQTATIAIVAFGMTMVLLTAGIDLSVGGNMALVCVICATAFTKGLPALGVVALGLILGAAIGCINGLIISVFNIQPFLVTMGMVNIARGFAKYITNGQSVFISNDGFRNIVSQGAVFGIPVLVFWIAIALIITFVIVNRTAFGRKIQAVGGNEEAAFFSGVKVKQVKVIVYTLSGLFAAAAGIITLSRLSSGLPTVGQGAEMDAIAAAVLGGTGFNGEGGNMLGTILGALVIGTIVNGLTVMGVDAYLQDVVKGFIIILTVIASVKLTSVNKAD